MRTLLTTIATLAVATLCFLMPTESSAQNPDICKPDCDSINFGPTETAVITLSNGCVVRVHYATRVACNNVRDLGIIAVEVIGNCPFLPTPSDMLKEVSELMIHSNPMNWTMPPNGQCIYTQRIVKGACWTIEPDCDHDSVYVPCDSVACCVVPVVICRDEFGQLFLDFQPPIVTEPCDSNLIWCDPVCEEETPTRHSGGNPDLGVAPLRHDSNTQPLRSSAPEPREDRSDDAASPSLIRGSRQ